MEESGTVRECQRARGRNSSCCELRAHFCKSQLLLFSVGWDLFQVTQRGERAVPGSEMRSRAHMEPSPRCLSQVLLSTP